MKKDFAISLKAHMRRGVSRVRGSGGKDDAQIFEDKPSISGYVMGGCLCMREKKMRTFRIRGRGGSISAVFSVQDSSQITGRGNEGREYWLTRVRNRSRNWGKGAKLQKRGRKMICVL